MQSVARGTKQEICRGPVPRCNAGSRQVAVGSGQVAVPRQDMLADPHPEAERFEVFHRDPYHVAVIGHLRRGDQSDEVALVKSRRTAGGAWFSAPDRVLAHAEVTRTALPAAAPIRSCLRVMSATRASGASRPLRPMKLSIRTM